jgi:hypothetical protein
MEKCWFDQLTAQHFKEIAQAATLPISGSKAKLRERLVACDDTNQFGYVPDKYLWGSKFGPEMTVSEIKNMCQQQGVSKTGNRYELVLRLLNKKFGATNQKESASKKQLVGDALQKGVIHRRQKLHGSLRSSTIVPSKEGAFRLIVPRRKWWNKCLIISKRQRENFPRHLLQMRIFRMMACTESRIVLVLRRT